MTSLQDYRIVRRTLIDRHLPDGTNGQQLAKYLRLANPKLFRKIADHKALIAIARDFSTDLRQRFDTPKNGGQYNLPGLPPMFGSFVPMDDGSPVWKLYGDCTPAEHRRCDDLCQRQINADQKSSDDRIAKTAYQYQLCTTFGLNPSIITTNQLFAIANR